MHIFLRAIGYSELSKREDIHNLIQQIIQKPDERKIVATDDDVVFAENYKYVSENIGICVRGEFNEQNEFLYDYYFPFVQGMEISSYEDVSVERHAEKESYAGVCDDLKVGVSIIFYLLNMINYLKLKHEKRLPIKGTSLNLSALSVNGTIMMPINKNEQQKKKSKKASLDRNHLIEQARQGDEEAIESLTLEDMDTYTVISKKIQKEDVFSLVDTYFMPYGIECDQYSILGEIADYSIIKNKLTDEEIIKMTIDCNELIIQVCINRKDLFGEPQVGRRFKGTVWLQGFINFPEE